MGCAGPGRSIACNEPKLRSYWMVQGLSVAGHWLRMAWESQGLAWELQGLAWAVQSLTLQGPELQGLGGTGHTAWEVIGLGVERPGLSRV